MGEATTTGLIPILRPTPISATPAVPQVPKEVPVKREKMRQMKKAITIKKRGSMVERQILVTMATVPLAFHSPTMAPTQSTMVMGTRHRAINCIMPVWSSL